MASFRVNGVQFASVALAQSVDKTRYYLNGVHVEPAPQGGVIMVATNGHILAAAYDPDGHTDGSYIVPVNRTALSALNAKGRGQPVASWDGASLTVETRKRETVSVSAPAIDGSFPDWRRVIPQEVGEIQPAVFNPDLLVKTRAILGRIPVLHQVGPEDPGFAHNPEGGIFVIVMPLRDVGDLKKWSKSVIPAWVKS